MLLEKYALNSACSKTFRKKFESFFKTNAVFTLKTTSRKITYCKNTE